MRRLLCASRNHDFDFFYSVLAGLRSAGSHCENSGSSDDTCASARSGRAKQRSLLCPLSERGCRHPLLFAVLDLLVLLDQAKSTRKESVRKNFPINFSGIIPSQCLEDFLRGADLPPFGTKRWRQKCLPGEKLRETHSSSLKRAPVAGYDTKCRFDCGGSAK